jgi:tetratricopeptide (TPR) repeat protein
MRLMRFLVILVAASLWPLHAAQPWLKITSSNFEMYTTAGGKEGRRTLEYFEQVRDFFMRIRSQQVTTRLPVTIVAFRNPKEYRPFSPRETASAYYAGDEQRDYIVLPGAGSDLYPAAVHEYMHLLIRHSGLKLPVWFNEGLAEVHSTMKPHGGQILIGTPPAGRAFVLTKQRWFPATALFNIRHDSAEFNETDRTGVFYAQSWLLTHMLMLSEAYGTEFAKFVVELSNTGSSESAFLKIYGKTPEQVDIDLSGYFRSAYVKGVLYDVKLQKMDVSEPRQATELESGLTLAKLTGLLRRTQEAERRLSDLEKAYPENWEVHEAIGHLYWQNGELIKARQKLRRSVELKSPSWKTHWDYARLTQGEPEVLDALKTTLQLNPDMAEARLMLGFELYKAKRYKEAYETLSSIKRVTPERAPSFFLAKAFSALEIGEKPAAKAAAAAAKKYASNAADIRAADEILDYVDRPARSAPQEPPQEATQDLGAIRGVLQEVECLGTRARLHILSGQIRVSLLIRDPERVQVKGRQSSEVQITCGPQKETRVYAEYVPVDDPELKTSGDIVSLQFQ